MSALTLAVADLGTPNPQWAIVTQPDGAEFEIVALDHGLLHLKGWDGEITLLLVISPLGSQKVDASVTMSRIQEPASFRQEICRLSEEAVADAVNRLIAQLMEASAL